MQNYKFYETWPTEQNNGWWKVHKQSKFSQGNKDEHSYYCTKASCGIFCWPYKKTYKHWAIKSAVRMHGGRTYLEQSEDCNSLVKIPPILLKAPIRIVCMANTLYCILELFWIIPLTIFHIHSSLCSKGLNSLHLYSRDNTHTHAHTHRHVLVHQPHHLMTGPVHWTPLNLSPLYSVKHIKCIEQQQEMHARSNLHILPCGPPQGQLVIGDLYPGKQTAIINCKILYT